MQKHYKNLIDQLDDLMIALTKQKKLGLDVEVMIALKNLTVARNKFKKAYTKEFLQRKETVFTNFLDVVSNNSRK